MLLRYTIHSHVSWRSAAACKLLGRRSGRTRGRRQACERTGLPASHTCQPASNPPFHNSEENQKVNRNPHADLCHYQKSITSRGSYLADACQVLSTSVSAFVSSCLQNDRRNDSTTERSHNSVSSAEVTPQKDCLLRLLHDTGPAAHYKMLARVGASE